MDTTKQALEILVHANNYIQQFETDLEVQAKAMFLIVQKMYRVAQLADVADPHLLGTINRLRGLIDEE